MKYTLFILAGQSNMVGQGTINQLPAGKSIIPSNVIFCSGTLKENLKINSPGESYHAQSFGPEISFVENYVLKYPDRKIIILKFAVNGTSLLAWDPEWSFEKASQTGNQDAGNLYAKLVKFIREIQGRYNVKIGAVLWMQGERDSKFPDAARDYHKNFTKFIASLRKDTGDESAPFIFGRVNPPADKFIGLEEVRKIQLNITKELKNLAMVNCDDLEKKTDNLHYNTAGQLELGKRFFEAFIKFSNR